MIPVNLFVFPRGIYEQIDGVRNCCQISGKSDNNHELAYSFHLPLEKTKVDGNNNKKSIGTDGFNG